MIDFASADPDAYVELWAPQVGDEVIVLVPAECDHVVHRWQNIPIDTRFRGTVFLVQADPSVTILKLDGPMSAYAVAEAPQRGHRFQVTWTGADGEWKSGVFAAAEIEPARGTCLPATGQERIGAAH